MRLENQSPLTINQTITADFKILEKVKSFNFTSYNLNIGHTAQFTHDSFSVVLKQVIDIVCLIEK